MSFLLGADREGTEVKRGEQMSDLLYYEDGEVVFEEGSIGNEMFIIERGKVEISLRVKESKEPIAVLGEGDFFGEMAALTDAPRSATATAIGDVILSSLCLEDILERMQTSPQFTVDIFRTLINRLRSTTSTLRTLMERA